VITGREPGDRPGQALDDKVASVRRRLEETG